MKKIMMVAVMAMASVAASAQIYVGGGLGFQYNNNKVTENADAVNSTQLSIKPEVGYYLSDNLALGVQFGVNSSKVGDADATTTWDATVYGRYDFVKVNAFTLGGELAVSYLNYGDNAGAGFGIAARPVARLNVCNNFDLVGRFNLVSYEKKNEKAGKGQNFGLGILNGNSNVELGVEFKF